MKRFLLLICTFFLSSVIFSQVRYWVGVSGGLWSVAANWSTIPGGPGGASSPTTTNNVIFDNGFNGVVEMDILSPATFTINSLWVTAASTVTLQRTEAAGGLRVFQMASTSSITPGIKIDNGSTLTIDAINTSGTLNYEFALTGAAGVTGEVSGNLYFKGSGTGTGGAEMDLQDDATHFAALAVKNAGLIKYFDNTGNTSPATGSYLAMEAGSTYEIAKNGGSFPPGTWDLNSLAKVFNAIGFNGPQFLGTAYGNLQWDCPAQAVASFLNANVSFNNVNFINTNGSAFRVKAGASAGNYTMTINGNLDIGNGAFVDLINASPAGSSGKILLKGSLNIQAGGFLTTNGAAGTRGQFELNGTSNQNITVDGFLQGVRLEFIMNGLSATLQTPMTLPGISNGTGANLQLVNGRIITTSTNLLTMIDNSITSLGSPSSFVAGPMKKIGHDDFIFPIGEGGEFAPIGISGGTGATIFDEFTARYFRGNPRVVIGPTFENPPINHMSILEWWTLDRSGAATKEVTLYARTYSDATLLSDLRVLRWDGAIWKNAGQVASTGVATGPVRSAVVSAFFASGTPTPFTFGSVTSTQNPLPITLISFYATKLSSSKSSVAWELTACCSAATKFEIQRAGSNRNFLSIGAMNGNTTSTIYNYIDNGLKKGINYYRLKMTDDNGIITYSRTVAIMNDMNGLLLTSLIPTVVTNTATLTVASSHQQKMDIVIVDMQGRIMQKNNYTISAGNTNIQINMSQLAAGIYQLTGITAEGRTNTIRFTRQY